MMSADEALTEVGEELAEVLEHHFHAINVLHHRVDEAGADLEDRLVRLLARLLPSDHPHYPGDPADQRIHFVPMAEEPWTLGPTHPDYVPQPAGLRWREKED